jgi:hypothetical protein
MWVRDRLDGLWRDDDFTEWYSRDERPGLSPAQLTAICVVPFLLNLSDRAARRNGPLPHRLHVRPGHGTGRSRFPPQCAGRHPPASHVCEASSFCPESNSWWSRCATSHPSASVTRPAVEPKTSAVVIHIAGRHQSPQIAEDIDDIASELDDSLAGGPERASTITTELHIGLLDYT